MPRHSTTGSPEPSTNTGRRAVAAAQCQRIKDRGDTGYGLTEIDERREQAAQRFLEVDVERVRRRGELPVALERVDAFEVDGGHRSVRCVVERHHLDVLPERA